MNLTRYFVSLSLIASIVACNEPSGIQTSSATSDSAEVGLGLPPILLTSRMIDRDQLRVDVTIGGQAVTMQRNANDEWVGQFNLPGPGPQILDITWFENVGGQDLRLAVATSTIDENSARNINIGSFSSDQFDIDGDTVSNLDERNANTNPFVPENQPAETPMPNADQSDCRTLTPTLTFSTFYVPSPSATFPTVVTISSNSQLEFQAETAVGALVYFEAYSIRTAGQLTITHIDHEPASSGALLYDTSAAGELRVLAEDTSRGTRASIVTDLQPGLYCYRLESTTANDPVENPIIQSNFIANTP